MLQIISLDKEKGKESITNAPNNIIRQRKVQDHFSSHDVKNRGISYSLIAEHEIPEHSK